MELLKHQSQLLLIHKDALKAAYQIEKYIHGNSEYHRFANRKKAFSETICKKNDVYVKEMFYMIRNYYNFKPCRI